MTEILLPCNHERPAHKGFVEKCALRRDHIGEHQYEEGIFYARPLDESAPVINTAAWVAFKIACADLKQAESTYKAAQLAYAEAVKRLSEEAVK